MPSVMKGRPSHAASGLRRLKDWLPTTTVVAMCLPESQVIWRGELDNSSAPRRRGTSASRRCRHRAEGGDGGGNVKVGRARGLRERNCRVTAHIDADEPVATHQDVEVDIAHRTHRQHATHHHALARDPEPEPGQLPPADGDVAEPGTPRTLDTLDGGRHREGLQGALEPAMQ